MKKIYMTFALVGFLVFSSCQSNDKQQSKNNEVMQETISSVNATSAQLDGIKKALDAYVEAAGKGDSNIAKPVFAKTATISHVENDSLVSGPIQELFDYYDQTGPHHAEYTITSAQVSDNVAVVSIDSKFGDAAFDDMFTLAKDGDEWKIVSKVFHVK